MQINAAKTSAMIFICRKDTPRTQIQLYQHQNPWSQATKYLAIRLDSKLKFTEQITKTRNNANQLANYSYPPYNRKSKLSARIKLQIYKAIIQSTLPYGRGSRIWKTLVRQTREN